MPNIAEYKDNLEAANTVFLEQFNEIFGEVSAPGLWSLFTEEVPIDGETMKLVFEDDLAEVHEWVTGQTKKYSGDRAYSVSYDVKTHYIAKELSRKRVTLDKSGVTAAALRVFLNRSQSMLDDLVWTELTSNPTGYDGVALVSSSHPNGPSGNQSNSTSSALDDSEFESGINAMRTLQKENGEYYNISPTHLFVHPDDVRRAREIVGAETRPVAVNESGETNQGSGGVGAVGITNVWRGIVDVVSEPRLTSGDWLLMDLSKPGIRPWTLGFARRPEAITADSMDDNERRNRDVFQWAIEADLAQGPAHWQVIYGRLQ